MGAKSKGSIVSLFVKEGYFTQNFCMEKTHMKNMKYKILHTSTDAVAKP